MTERGWYIFFGLVTAIIVGIMIFPDEVDQAIDSLGDIVYNLTSSEQSRFDQLNPDVQTQLRTLIAHLNEAGMKVYVGTTLRTPADEKAAIVSGHSSATLKHSWHEIARAVDLYPINPDTGGVDYAGARDDLFIQMHQIAQSLGWQGIAYEAELNGGDWTRHYLTTTKGKTWDGGHLEWHAPYDNLTDAIAAEGSQYGLA